MTLNFQISLLNLHQALIKSVCCILWYSTFLALIEWSILFNKTFLCLKASFVGHGSFLFTIHSFILVWRFPPSRGIGWDREDPPATRKIGWSPHVIPTVLPRKCWFCNFHAVFGHYTQIPHTGRPIMRKLDTVLHNRHLWLKIWLFLVSTNFYLRDLF